MLFWKKEWTAKKPAEKRIYADAAASTPLSKKSRDELVRLLDVYGNAGALHSEGVDAKNELEKARESIAQSIGAHADEIIFTGTGTEGNNLAIQGVLRPLLQEHGELHAITSAIEHQSVLEPLRALESEGLYITELPVDSEGLVDPKAVYDAINEETVFVSIQLLNSEVGTIEPVHEIAKKIRKIKGSRAGAAPSIQAIDVATSFLPLFFHTDASQAPLWMKVGVEQLGIDLMTLDAQKVLGPKGVGVLFIRRGTDIEPIIWGGSHERGIRAGTPNVPLAGAFAVALSEAQKNVEERAREVAEIRDYCISEIKKVLPDVIINGPKEDNRAPNNINVSVPGLEAQMAVIALNVDGISASTRSACDIGDVEPSHVIQALGVPKELAGTAIRITFLPDITKIDAKKISDVLADVAKRYRTR